MSSFFEKLVIEGFLEPITFATAGFTAYTSPH